eukprot:scaffold7890_cov112-Isochrysis_galbana.AAC.4
MHYFGLDGCRYVQGAGRRRTSSPAQAGGTYGLETCNIMRIHAWGGDRTGGDVRQLLPATKGLLWTEPRRDGWQLGREPRRQGTRPPTRAQARFGLPAHPVAPPCARSRGPETA